MVPIVYSTERQNDQNSEVNGFRREYFSEEVNIEAEVPPEFPGGISGFYRYISENMIYPKSARSTGVQGKVYIEFVVTENGEVKDVRTVKGIGGGCDAEAERVMRNAPTFTPAYNDNGEPIAVRIDHWLKPFKALWGKRLDKLDNYLNELQGKTNRE